MPRRFPAPWTIDEANDACFIVRDHNGQALAYVYFEDEPGRRFRGEIIGAGRGEALIASTHQSSARFTSCTGQDRQEQWIACIDAWRPNQHLNRPKVSLYLHTRAGLQS